ncbi:MAG: hypothetical protein LC797_13315 [Chloroflexi bacterium]|nr:hypothetical protein [Chloroflexota bacterium]
MNDDDFAELFKKLPSRPSAGTSWQDVAAEFEALGKTLGDVVRDAWRRQDTDAGLGRLRDSLDAMVRDVNRAVEGTPDAQQARDQFVHLTDSLRAAAERASDELRPELLSMLRQANGELRRLSGLDDD